MGWLLQVTMRAKKKKKIAIGEDEDAMTGEVHPRQQANATFQEFRRCVQGIFEAENQLSGAQGGTSQHVIVIGEQEPTMTSELYTS